jgi:hypothetical protein
MVDFKTHPHHVLQNSGNHDDDVLALLGNRTAQLLAAGGKGAETANVKTLTSIAWALGSPPPLPPHPPPPPPPPPGLGQARAMF